MMSPFIIYLNFTIFFLIVSVFLLYFFLQQEFIVSGFHGFFYNNSILNGIILLDFHNVLPGFSSIALIILPIEYHVYWAWKVHMIPWSRDWITHIVFGGKQTTSTLLVLSSWGSGWPGTLSNIKQFFFK